MCAICTSTLALAFDMSAEGLAPDEPLTTGRLLHSLAMADDAPGWSRVWLHAGYPTAAQLRSVPDSPSRPTGRTWHGFPITTDLAAAHDWLASFVVAHGWPAAPPGACALALLLDPANGAARTLTAAGLGHDDLLALVQDELVGERYPDLGTVHPPPQQEPAAPGDGYPAPGLPQAVADRAGQRPADEWDALAVLGAGEGRHLLDRAGLAPAVLDTWETRLRQLPSRSFADLTRRLPEPGADTAVDVVRVIATDPSPALTALLHAQGLTTEDVLFEVALAQEDRTAAVRVHIPALRPLTIAAALAGPAVVVATLGTAVLAGPWWLAPLAVLAFPTQIWHTWLPWLAAAVLAVALGPWLGLAQAVRCLLEWLVLRRSRTALMAASGVPLHAPAARRRARSRLVPHGAQRQAMVQQYRMSRSRQLPAEASAA